jgi:ABC-type transport system involved in cytochrome c biogenesis permease subunit
VKLVNPKQFLVIGGIVLAVVGILGFINILGPTADASIFGSAWWFDNGENWAHLVLGIVGLLAAFTLPAGAQKSLVALLGIIGVLVGLYSLFSPNFLGANLENPADTILHLAVGAWALYAAYGKGKSMASAM